MPEIPSRWSTSGDSIFTIMTRESVRAGAINLAQGFPDFDGPEHIKEAATEAIRAGKNQYAPSIGVFPLRQALARAYEESLGRAYDPETEITVFSGATEALFCAISSLCEPGDEVLCFEPFYDSYPAAVKAAGARFAAVTLQGPEWSIREDLLAAAIGPRTKAILVNTPHNPTGKVFTRDELELVAGFARKHDLFVICDEVYEHLVFPGNRHVSLATLPGMADRTITISSTAKSFSMTGWKLGYAFAPPRLSAALRALHQFTVFCSSTPLQWGMVAAFSGEMKTSLGKLREELGERRDYLHEALIQSGFRCRKTEGSYFIMADYGALSASPDKEFALWMTHEIGVSAIPVSAFCRPEISLDGNYVRFAFCKKKETLKEAATRLGKLAPGSG